MSWCRNLIGSTPLLIPIIAVLFAILTSRDITKSSVKLETKEGLEKPDSQERPESSEKGHIRDKIASIMEEATSLMPVIFLSHGAGPMWFISENGSWSNFDRNSKSAEFMRKIRDVARLPRQPPAVLVISAHWEEKEHTVLTSPKPSLYFDYYGFPDETYKLKWPVPGAPSVARRTKELLQAAGIKCLEDGSRGLDHGVFIPLKLAYPEADIPVFQVSLKKNLDISDHLRLGEVLQPLRSEGVLIVGSGMTTHNLQEHSDKTTWCEPFRVWFNDVYTNPGYSPDERKRRVLESAREPTFAQAHPRSEHYLPMTVACAAAGYQSGTIVYEEIVLGNIMSYVRFD